MQLLSYETVFACLALYFALPSGLRDAGLIEEKGCEVGKIYPFA